jgi:hypothetical protein
MKTQITTLDNESRTCDKTRLLPGSKSVFTLLMRLFLAAVLMLTAFGA